jgi:hypothetical protein
MLPPKMAEVAGPNAEPNIQSPLKSVRRYTGAALLTLGRLKSLWRSDEPEWFKIGIRLSFVDREHQGYRIMGKIIGIDLGTTNSRVAIMDGKTPKGRGKRRGRAHHAIRRRYFG